MCDHTLELIFDLRAILRFESYVIGIVAREPVLHEIPLNDKRSKKVLTT